MQWLWREAAPSGQSSAMVPTPLRARLSLLFIPLGLGVNACGRDGGISGRAAVAGQ